MDFIRKGDADGEGGDGEKAVAGCRLRYQEFLAE